MRIFVGITCGFLLACLVGAGSARSGPSGNVFQVTIKATVTKEWNTVVESTMDGCPVTLRSIGTRTVKLRSVRPTLVTVTVRAGRASYSPSIVRVVRAVATQTGSRVIRTLDPCTVKTVRSTCPKVRRVLPRVGFVFYRSRRNEISFVRAGLPRPRTSCPPESGNVRAIRPGLQDAEGEISEAALANPRVPGQTVYGSSQVTTELRVDETGTVVERVRWELSFDRA
jgi:hypothetical protein